MLLGDEYDEYDEYYSYEENNYIQLGKMFVTIFDEMVLYIVKTTQSLYIENKKENKLTNDVSTQTDLIEEKVTNWEIL